MAEGIQDESGVAQGLPQSPRQAVATAPGAAAHPSHQRVHGTGAQPHSDLPIHWKWRQQCPSMSLTAPIHDILIHALVSRVC